MAVRFVSKFKWLLMFYLGTLQLINIDTRFTSYQFNMVTNATALFVLRPIPCKFIKMPGTASAPALPKCVTMAFFDDIMMIGFNGSHCAQCSVYHEGPDKISTFINGDFYIRNGIVYVSA